MEYYSVSLPNVIPLTLVKAQANYGVGLLTSIMGGFGAVFEISNNCFRTKSKKTDFLFAM